jgi:hypothetical protein
MAGQHLETLSKGNPNTSRREETPNYYRICRKRGSPLLTHIHIRLISSVLPDSYSATHGTCILKEQTGKGAIINLLAFL